MVVVRRFQLERDEDASGVSGTGVVAQGVQFDDGSCAMRWLTATSSTAMYASAGDVETIHGHEGRTRLVWLDAAAPRVRDEADELECCGCDFVQILADGDSRVELHHVIPDDGAPHVEDPDCPCGPEFDRLETELVVVDHRDQAGP